MSTPDLVETLNGSATVCLLRLQPGLSEAAAEEVCGDCSLEALCTTLQSRQARGAACYRPALKESTAPIFERGRAA